jgi:hypothetical protein
MGEPGKVVALGDVRVAGLVPKLKYRPGFVALGADDEDPHEQLIEE